MKFNTVEEKETTQECTDLFARCWPVSTEEDADPYRLGQILLRMGAITPAQLQKTLEEKEAHPVRLIGQIALDFGFCSIEQLNLALDKQKKETMVGQVLIRQGIITEEVLEEVVKEQSSTGKLIGFLLVEKKICTKEQLEKALKNQRRDNRLGALLLRHGIITEKQFEKALAIQEETKVLLGEIFIQLGYVTEEQLHDILISQKIIMTQLPK